jgi:hypothetical protein
MTLEELKQHRLAKTFSGDAVTIWLDAQYLPLPDSKEIALSLNANIERLDLRPLVGLSVFVHAYSYSDKLVRLYERIKEHAAFAMVVIVDFGDDLGWKWHRLNGEMPV